jgi:4-hydroxybenzoate polyprenyltransferase
LTTVKNYLSLIKFSHTIFAMPFALIGFFLGTFKRKTQWNLNDTIGWNNDNELISGQPHFSLPAWRGVVFDPVKFMLIIGCMIFARSAAMAFNRYLDSSFDAKNPRTAIREIPAGVIKSNSALWFVIGSCLLFVVCTFFINRICFYLSPVALFVVLFYSYTKRFTALCHLVLGTGLALAPIGAYLAVTGVFHLLPLLFSFTVLFWVSGFDIIYALQDEAFDKAHKLHSIPALLGTKRALRVSELLHGLSAACLVTAGLIFHFGWLYWAGVALFACLLVYQHLLVKPNDLSRVNMAFFTTNGIASVIFAIFVILDIFLHAGLPV